MRQLMNTIAVKHAVLLLSFIFLAISFNDVLVAAEENGSEARTQNEVVGEILKGVEDTMVQHKKRRKALEESVREPLTETQEKLLRQLLQQPGTLDDILSSAPYLAYLKTEVGGEYKDFSAYVAAMPTPKQKTEMLFALKKMLPPKTKAEALSISTDYYFKFRSLSVKKPDILAETNTLIQFQAKHLMQPLMATYPTTEFLAHMSELTQIATVTNLEGLMHTQVFHDLWQEHSEKYGSSEGLLRSAITTPAEFALVRSFVQDTATFEKWIQEPLKTEKEPEGENGN